jgi:hypothetical protein
MTDAADAAGAPPPPRSHVTVLCQPALPFSLPRFGIIGYRAAFVTRHGRSVPDDSPGERSDMSALRDFASLNGRKAMFEARRFIKVPRAMPDFIVIGAQKSGTSSMFVYLKQHPQILRPVFKEPYYFDRHYDRGLAWYGRNFPARATVERLNDRHARAHLTFEATATYVFDARVPERIAREVETRKFIALLRDPTDRAISAYWHARRMGLESRSLEEALKIDLERYEGEKAFEEGRGPEPPGPPPRPTYLRRGIYHEAVSRWQRLFPPENLLLIQSETMFADPRHVMAQVFEFLGLPPAEDIDFAPQNVGAYDDRDAPAQRFLRDFYRPHVAELSRLTGRPFTW